ncbi:MAG: TonB C-terminal domain-containing protein, partial [Candidatus Deferrimicrobium sp.]
RGGGGYLAWLVATDKGGPAKAVFQSVTLLKPADVKEKPPEPEPPKEMPKMLEEARQTIEAPTMASDAAAGPRDDGPPAGNDLGVDAEGGAGGDSFGLVGRKGGRGITTLGPGGGGGGGGGKLSLFGKYGWYTRKIQDEVRAEVKRRFDREGGFPKGKLQTIVRVVVDDRGVVVSCGIVTSSGMAKMDNAVIRSLEHMRISEPPPEGMPKGMTLRIASQG